MLPLPPGLPGDQYRVKLSYFHSMTFDTQQGKYVLRLPSTVPQVGGVSAMHFIAYHAAVLNCRAAIQLCSCL